MLLFVIYAGEDEREVERTLGLLLLCAEDGR